MRKKNINKNYQQTKTPKTTYLKHCEDENDLDLTVSTFLSSTITRLDSHLTCPLFQFLNKSTGTGFVGTKSPQFFCSRDSHKNLLSRIPREGVDTFRAPALKCLGTGLLMPDHRWQGGKGDSRDTSTFVTRWPIAMFLPANSSREGRVCLPFTQTGLLLSTSAGIVMEKGSEYIFAHTVPSELERHPLGGCGSGFFLSFFRVGSRLYYPFGKGLGQH